MDQIFHKEHERIGEYDQLLILVQQARAVAQSLGDTAAMALLESMHRLCVTRVQLLTELQAAPKDSTSTSEPSESLTVYMLGPFQLFLNGALINGWRKKSAAVLKYLIMHRSTLVHRDQLLDLFWPRSDLQAARNCLNVTLHSLRRMKLEPDVGSQPNSSLIEFADDHYHLNARLKIWTDVDMFVAQTDHGHAALQLGDRAHAIARYEQAVALYRGDFLEGDRYEEWTMGPRERLRSLHLSLLGQLSVLHFEAGNYLLAIDRSQEILERDNCCEDAHRMIMRSYQALGQRGLALRQYTLSRDILARELNVAPMEATNQLYEQIKAHALNQAN